MTGLYIHIPFCKSRCIYCDFYSTTSQSKQEVYVKSVCQELELKHNLIESDSTLSSIYFGGGTPSLLSVHELEAIFDAIHRHYSLPPTPIEITLEANPDDITPDYVKALCAIGINRVSLGVQSFSDEQLAFLGRRHNSAQVRKAMDTLRECGIENISIDLIYGLPEAPLSTFKESLDEAMAIRPPHLSAYALTYEEGTRLTKMATRGNFKPKGDDEVATEYQLLTDTLAPAGYLHYEVSNFALPQWRAHHNSAYWQRRPYLGIGLSAHSFLILQKATCLGDKLYPRGAEVRFANEAHLLSYERAISKETLPLAFVESLTKQEQYNEAIMLGLRTQEGIDLHEIKRQLGTSATERLLRTAQPYIAGGILRHQGQRLFSTERGFFVIDGIIASLFC